THGSTYGGNPLGMAAGLAVLDVVAEPEFLAHVRDMGDRLRHALEQFIPNHDDLFESVRGKGLMLGIRMTEVSRPFVNFARQFGILTVAAGDNVVRILPPLNIDESHIAECTRTLSDAANAYREAKATGKAA
ncbi:MAG: aminotransferase class III-fold pyridoxal phosphate-dependent enzyme, partial [Pseudomonadota bacterium]